MADLETVPTIFDATQVYSPAWLAATVSIVNCLLRFPELVTATSSVLDCKDWPSNSQSMSKGKSPLDTVHCTDTVSPAFAGSSPSENNAICGATANKIFFVITNILKN